MLKAFQEKRFSESSLEIIEQANEIIAEYLEDGLKLTLRQLYYQFVSRDLIKNKQSEYKRLGSIINDARLAGKIDWSSIEDRGRNLQSSPAWDSPEEIIKACASQYATDLWADQPYRVEVWIEKQALEGVIERICQSLRVSYFSCKGYVSQSEMFDAGYYRLSGYVRRGQTPVILHFGDHDPSGIDMTRDIEKRLRMFISETGTSWHNMEIRRLALTMDQIEKYNPPPNPAKVTDSRFDGYMAVYGDESWELDALDPHVLVDLIRTEVEGLRDERRWRAKVSIEGKQRASLVLVSENYKKVINLLNQAKDLL